MVYETVAGRHRGRSPALHSSIHPLTAGPLGLFNNLFDARKPQRRCLGGQPRRAVASNVLYPHEACMCRCAVAGFFCLGCSCCVRLRRVDCGQCGFSCSDRSRARRSLLYSTSSNHLLDLLAIAEPATITLGDRHPVAWVFAMCRRAVAQNDECPGRLTDVRTLRRHPSPAICRRPSADTADQSPAARAG